ncbi:MAG: hypothetical protein CMH54_06550 [Myxococcales bacterium]|nr:hypothetical protein [Myxococcales bacterium]|tara:strand:+ start:355 stop:1866 length:1512 start_codon:yes stop_codon:yes gene_type:complete
MSQNTKHPQHRVQWEPILNYARRFEEFDIVSAIRSDSTYQDVELGDETTPRQQMGQPIDALGPFRVGQTVENDWSIQSLQLLEDRVRFIAENAGGDSITLALCGPDGGASNGPWDVDQVRISYEPTELPFPSFDAVGRTVSDTLRQTANGKSADQCLAEWIQDANGNDSGVVRTHHLPDTDTVQIRPDGKVYLRITDSCQERCIFCFFYDTDEIDNLIRHHELDDVISRLDPKGLTQVILTGGEPTLHPKLPDYIGQLVDKGFSEIIIQTNGVKLIDEGYFERLMPYRDQIGLGFSLHATDEETNDKVTTVARGLYPKKLEAIRRSAELGFRMKIIFVMNRMNLSQMVGFIELIHELAGPADPYVQFSLPSFEGRMNLFLDQYPRLEELRTYLPPALRRGRELNMRVSLCHQCQVPPCVVPDDLPHLESLWVQESLDEMWDLNHAYGDQCSECAMRPWCPGVWSDYPKHFDLNALVPFKDHEIEPRPEGLWADRQSCGTDGCT